MQINECNKNELLWIVEQAVTKEVQEAYLAEIQAKRKKVKDDFVKYATDKTREYKELMGPYEGVDVMKIPMDVLKKGQKLLKEVSEAADRLERMG